MTTAPIKPKKPKAAPSDQIARRILLPYALAILAQTPMLFLYFRNLWGVPHYQPFAIAILATIAISVYRWPFDVQQPFHRSMTSDFLFALGLGFAFLGMIFVEPWFSALSSMLVVTSLLSRTVDREVPTSTLWACSLPLYVYLTLPFKSDFSLINSLQRYSAIYTSRLLDLLGLGHHMDGTVIKVPGSQEYGIEQACSGVQSFFTLVLVAVVFIVMSRRIKIPNAAVGLLAVSGAILCFVLRATILTQPGAAEAMLLLGAGLILLTFLGFRAAALILSAVFWAVFMNTIRIFLIPVADNMFLMDLSHGLAHDVLGYSALALGILMLFSTDQFLLFLFGPVELSSSETTSVGRIITKFWNNVLAGSDEESNDSRRTRKRSGRRPIEKSNMVVIWSIAGLMIVMGLFQFNDVRLSAGTTDDVRFFDVDVSVEYELGDLPADLFEGESDSPREVWTRVDDRFATVDRSQGSDLGKRSDVWQYQSPRCVASASLDQTFPGWHELTTCYKNQGWNLTSRIRKTPKQILGEDASDDDWSFIEATFEKKTGEKAYLLFSHFDSFGEGIDAPGEWGTLNSFVMRVKNRLSHRIRGSLFRAEAYQTQVFLASFNEISPALKQEVNERYLKIREQLRKRFLEKKAAEDEA